MQKGRDLIKGKGAQFNPKNKFAQQRVDIEDEDVVHEYVGGERPQTQLFIEHPKKIISEYTSPDVPGAYSVNAYQGCEHGCVYCYARESHQYWGFSAGLDFESKIIVKQNAPELLRQAFQKKNYKPETIMMSGNTDCYQPIERQFQLTRKLLEVLLEFRNPVGIITKNSLIERDLDILKEMAALNLAHVYFSITTLDESLRRTLEPRTASAEKKLAAMKLLADAGIPVGVMAAPIIPGLNHHEIPEILRRAAENGATAAGYTVVRLNGEISAIFEDWLFQHYPERKNKVIHQIEELHGGNVQDRRFGKRMSGEGPHAQIIKQLFQVSKSKYFVDKVWQPLTTDLFRRSGEWGLF
jgi:DNA repair photolyase